MRKSDITCRLVKHLDLIEGLRFRQINLAEGRFDHTIDISEADTAPEKSLHRYLVGRAINAHTARLRDGLLSQRQTGKCLEIRRLKIEPTRTD